MRQREDKCIGERYLEGEDSLWKKMREAEKTTAMYLITILTRNPKNDNPLITPPIPRPSARKKKLSAATIKHLTPKKDNQTYLNDLPLTATWRLPRLNLPRSSACKRLIGISRVSP